MFSSRLKGQSGFTIVEILIAVAMMAAISVGVMRLMENMSKTSKDLQNRDEFFQITNNIALILSQPLNCQETLLNKEVNDEVVTIWRDAHLDTKRVSHSVNTERSAKIEINRMWIEEIDTISRPDGSTAKAVLAISFRKPEKISIGGQDVVKRVNISANLCTELISFGTNRTTLEASCTGANQRITSGPTAWRNETTGQDGFQMVCQDCSDITKIKSCRSSNQADVSDAQLVGPACRQLLGGTYNEDTRRCEGSKLCDVELSLMQLTNSGGTTSCGDEYFVETVTRLVSSSTSLSIPQNFAGVNITARIAGGGGAGGGSDRGNPGAGGSAGTQRLVTLVVKKGDTCTLTIGSGGIGGSGNGGPGGTTRISCAGMVEEAAGGAGGREEARGAGESCGWAGESITFNGVTYAGGRPGCRDSNGSRGSSAAGGGGAGDRWQSGGNGGSGLIWISYQVLTKR